MVSPIISGVRNDQVILACLGAPAEDLDGVAAQLRTADVAIHTTGVGRDVLVHREGTGDRTVLHHILLDSFRDAQAVRRAGLLLVVTVCPWVRGINAS